MSEVQHQNLPKFYLKSSVADTWWADSIQQSQCCITSILLVSFHPGISRQDLRVLSQLIHFSSPECISSSDIMESGEPGPGRLNDDMLSVLLIEFSWYPVSGGRWFLSFMGLNIQIYPDHAILWHFPRHKDYKLSQKSSFFLILACQMR